ncbi:putative selenate ABC transporter substrate-binding protein [Roseateles noduli]|nr:putative selenate ABC transporter substrate-binding protein [Roseateles noduli]
MPDSWRQIGPAMRAFFAAWLISAGMGGPAQAQTPQVLRVTVLPFGSPVELNRRYAPLVRYLEKELERKIEWTQSADYDASVAAIVDGRTDLVMLGGLTFVQAHQRSGGRVIPLVQRDKDANYRSMFITPVDSGIRRLEDLKGRSFSFGPRSSTSGHLMPRAFLQAAKIDPEADFRQVVYSSGHDATVAAVVTGKVDAGVLHTFAWEKLVAAGRVDTSTIRVFYTSPPFSDTNWSVHADMPAATRKAIAAAFLKIDGSTPEEQEILALQEAAKFVPTRVENYQRIRAVAESAGLLK